MKYAQPGTLTKRLQIYRHFIYFYQLFIYYTFRQVFGGEKRKYCVTQAALFITCGETPFSLNLFTDS